MGDTKRREPGCECLLEEGDSPCIVHGLYEADTVAADTKRGAVRAAVLECCRAWEPQARVLGNVTAGELADLLEHVVTAADKAVLDACAALKIRYDGKSGDLIVSGDLDVVHAELARREAAK